MSSGAWLLALLPMAGYGFFLLRHAAALRVLLAKPPLPVRAWPTVTVVVPARNEAAHLPTLLAGLLAQRYPARYEIILVNDRSTDATAALAQAAATADVAGRLRVLSLEGPPPAAPKKQALAAGIALATGEVIVTTDADCRHEPHWLQALVAPFAGPGVGAVAGPVRLAPTPTLGARLLALEQAGLSGLAAGAIAVGTPMLANGACLAFRRAAFGAVGGYAGTDHVASGDDELLLHKFTRAGIHVAFAASHEALAETAAPPTLAAWHAQRIRWVSKARAYRHWRMSAAQVQAWLACALLLASLPLAALGHAPLWLPVALLLMKTGAEAAMLWPATRLTGQRALRRWLLPAQLPHAAYVVYIGVAGFFARGYVWKDRRLR